MASALQIGTKFQIDSMRKEALARLSVCFPSSLQEFHNGVSLVPTHDVPHTTHRPIALKPRDAITVFHLARTFGLDELVPAAIYTCAQLTIDDLFHACQAGSLTFCELKACIRERQTLQNECLLKPLIFAKGELSPDCTRSEQSDVMRCAEDMKGLAEAAVGLQASQGDDSAPDALMPVLDEWVLDDSLCEACQAYLTARHEQERQQIWDRLWKKYVLVCIVFLPTYLHLTGDAISGSCTPTLMCATPCVCRVAGTYSTLTMTSFFFFNKLHGPHLALCTSLCARNHRPCVTPIQSPVEVHSYRTHCRHVSL